MPTTARWISGAYPETLADNTPYKSDFKIQEITTYITKLDPDVSSYT